MRTAVGACVIGGLAAAAAGAQPLVPPEALARGRELMTLGDPLGAADAFHEALLGRDAGLHTVRVGVFCDVANLERRARAVGNAPELFVLRRPVGGRPCLALYWGLFPSREAALAAIPAMPAALHAAGQSSVAVSDVLPPGAPPPGRAAAAPPAPTPPAAPVEPPTAAPEAPDKPVAAEPFVPEPREAPAEPPPTAPPASVPEVSAPLPPTEPVSAPRMEATVAYSGLRDDTFSKGGRDGFFELGWALSLCGNLSRSIGVVGEASGHYSSEDTLDPAGALLTVDRDLFAVHAGLRYTHRGPGRVAAYVQALAGWTRSGVQASGRRTIEDDFSVQPGLGVQIELTKSVGLALGADYRLVFGEQQDRGEVRYLVGVVIAAGVR